MDELDKAVSDQTLNLKPTTDENPYFFNMLKIKHLINPYVFLKLRETGIFAGNLIANIVLGVLVISLFILTLLMIVLPLLIKSKIEKIKLKNLFY